MNLANKITIMRIVLIPFILLFLLPLPFAWAQDWNNFVAGPGAHFIALLIFALACLSDFLDGRIARSRNLVSNFGKLMDPIADKLLVLVTFMAFVQRGRIGTLFLALIMAREFIVTGIRQIAATHGKVIAASKFGKWKTFSQMLCLIWLILEPVSMPHFGIGRVMQIGNSWCAFALIMTLLSGLDYWMKNKDIIFS